MRKRAVIFVSVFFLIGLIAPSRVFSLSAEAPRVLSEEEELLLGPAGVLVPKIIFPRPSLESIEAEKEPGEPEKEGYELLWLTRFSATLTYSWLSGGEPLLGQKTNWIVAPVWQFSEKDFLIMLYQGNFLRKKQVYTEDEGGKVASETFTQSITPTYRRNFSQSLTGSLAVFYSQSLKKETLDEKWSKGLYDYVDRGFSGTLTYLLSVDNLETKTLNIKTQFYNREYPNFRSLYFLAGLGLMEEKEKDHQGVYLSGTFSLNRKLGYSYSGGVSIHRKAYVDKLVENEIGGRSYEKQKDFSYSLWLTTDLKPEGPFFYTVTARYDRTESNQNLAEGSFPAITFHPDYFSNRTVSLTPSATFTLPVSEKEVIYLTGSAFYSVTDFDNRRPRDGDGNLISGTEKDKRLGMILSARYKVSDNLSLMAGGDFTKSESNMKFERVYRYNYDMYSVWMGVSYQP